MKSLVLTAALESTEIAPTPAAARRGPAIVRNIGAERFPLDLTVIPFRYRVRAGAIEPVRTACHHRRRVSR